MRAAGRCIGHVARDVVDVAAAILKPRVDAHGDSGQRAIAIDPVTNGVGAAESAGGKGQRVARDYRDGRRAACVRLIGERAIVGGEGGGRGRRGDCFHAVARVEDAAVEPGNVDLRAGLQIVRHAGGVRGHTVGAHATGERNVVGAERRGSHGGLPRGARGGEAALAVFRDHLISVSRAAVHQVSRRDGRLARRRQRGCDAGFRNHHAVSVQEIAAAACARQCGAAGIDGARDGGRRTGGAAVAAETREAEVRIRTFALKVAVEILLRGEGVGRIGLRAAAACDRTDLGAGVIFVVEALVRSFCVEIYGAGARCAWRRGLIGEIECAAGQIADHRGVAIYCEIAAEVQRERADRAAAVDAAERWRARIVRQDDVGELLGGDARAGDFDFVFSWRGVEGIVAEAVGGGGISERLR